MRLLFILLVLVAALSQHASVHAQAAAGDAPMKARLALAITRFTQWPVDSFARADSPLVLCVLHASPSLAAKFREAVAAAGPLNGRAVLPLFNVVPGPEVACHVVFVDASAPRYAERAALESASKALTMGTAEGFVGRGGMVEIVNVDDALRFDVDIAAVQRAGLGVRPSALKLARRVRQ